MSHWSTENSTVCHSAGLSIRGRQTRKGSKETYAHLHPHKSPPHTPDQCRLRGRWDTNDCQTLLCCRRSKGQGLIRNRENTHKNSISEYFTEPFLFLFLFFYCAYHATVCWTYSEGCSAWLERSKGKLLHLHAKLELFHPPLGSLLISLNRFICSLLKEEIITPATCHHSVLSQWSVIMQKLKYACQKDLKWGWKVLLIQLCS